MHAWNRIKYEYRNRPLIEFLKWFYRAARGTISVKFHGLLSDLIGEEKYLRYLKKWRCRKLDPEKYIEIMKISPEEIEHVSSTREKQKWFSTGKIRKGDWDRNLDRYNDLPFHRAMTKHIEKGLDWRDIKEVQKAREGGIKWPGKPYKVDRDIEKTEKLLESIKEHGYQTQEQIHDISYEEAEKNWRLKALNEICVDLDRDGNPLFVDGRHRLSIAKILGLEEIPVRVITRHRNYLKK